MAHLALSDLESYFFADPASGKTRLKKTRARQAIVGISVDHLMRIFCIFAWAGRIPTSQFRDKIVATYDTYQPRRFGIESNAMQELFGDLVIDQAKAELPGTNIRIIGVPSPTKIEKDFKIRTTLEPLMNNGRLFVPEDFIELRAELFGFPTASTKDLIDALAMAISLIPRRTAKQQHTSELAARLDYLRRSGAPARYIAQVAAEMQETSARS